MKKTEPTRGKAAREKKKNEKAAGRSALEEMKKEEDDLYPVRKGKMLRVARIVLWVMLGFVFVRGVMVTLRPDPTATVNQAIKQFKADYSSFQKQDSEVMAFAEGFATDYLSYSSLTGVEEYKKRLERYASDGVISSLARIPSGKSAQVIHALAYKQEPYSDGQIDVWVKLDVSYSQITKSADGIESTQSSTEGTILKVPVRAADGRYIVEDVPAFVNDEVKVMGFKPSSYSGVEVDADTTKAITEALSNFYRAYYESEQAVINYYLSPDADPSKFVGLGGRVTFKTVSAIRAYNTTETDTGHYKVILTATVIDKNGMELPQNFNLALVYRDKQYYIVTMDTRNKDVA